MPTASPHARLLALAHVVYGSLSAALALLTAAVGLLALFFGQFLLACLATLVGTSLAEQLAGADSSLVRLVIALWRFGPVVLTIVSLVAALAIALVFVSPFFLTAYAIRRGRSWGTLWAIVAIILSITVFPFGTILALFTGWYLLSGKLTARG
jgi:hypothetical protein